jgi:alkylresorcinol/alkylpyrone synthase
MVELLPVATALPPHCIEADEAKRHLDAYFGSSAARRYREMVDGSRVRRRYTVAPVPDLLKLRTLPERNEMYAEHALRLGETVARDALSAGATAPDSVTAVLSVSCTGYMMPSLDAHLVGRLGLPSTVRRIPLTELGCSAGVSAVGLAADLLGATSTGNVLLVSVEVSSPSVQVAEPSMTDMIANLLFGDGAVGVVLTNRTTGAGPLVVASQSILLPTTLDHLGMRLTDAGFRIVLSNRLPQLIRQSLRPTLERFLNDRGAGITDIKFWAIHPGGPKILQAVAESLDLTDRAMQPAWDVWEDRGNLSSSTVFFVLNRIKQSTPPKRGDFGMMLAFGPGLTCEMVLLRADGWLSSS